MLSANQRGQLAELGFCYELLERGIDYATPHTEGLPYDVITISGCKLSRVQIKSTYNKYEHGGHNTYRIGVKCRGGKYNETDFDYLAATVMPLHIWYVIPASEAVETTNIYLYPHIESVGRFEGYRDAWHFFDGVRK